MRHPIQAPGVRHPQTGLSRYTGHGLFASAPASCDGKKNEITCGDHCCDAKTQYCWNNQCRGLPMGMGHGSHLQPKDEFAIRIEGNYFGMRG